MTSGFVQLGWRYLRTEVKSFLFLIKCSLVPSSLSFELSAFLALGVLLIA